MNIDDLLCPVCGGTGKMDGGPRPPSYSFDDEYEHDMIEAVGGYGEQPCPNGCVGVRVPYDHEDYGPGTVVTHLVGVIPWCETHKGTVPEKGDGLIDTDPGDVCLKRITDRHERPGPCVVIAAYVEKVGELA